MSELSTVAIKDGHRGHFPHNHQPMDAERADRISRLAGLERVAGPRTLTPGSAQAAPYAMQAYFDANNQPQLMRERSTVGSASATGSVGGRTTWASETASDAYDPDKMSEDQDIENSSVGGFSDEGAPSLVGFGEGARTPARQMSLIGSPVTSKAPNPSAVPPYLRGSETPSGGMGSPLSEAQQRDARMTDGVAYDSNALDSMSRSPPSTADSDQAVYGRSPSGADSSERRMRERFGQEDAASR